MSKKLESTLALCCAVFLLYLLSGWLILGPESAQAAPISTTWRMTTSSDDVNDGSVVSDVPMSYTLTISTEGRGSVLRSPDMPAYPAGTGVRFKAIPSVGSSFAGWSGAVSGTMNPNGIRMDANKTVTATFIPLSYTLTIFQVECGYVLRSPDMAAYPYGTVVYLKAKGCKHPSSPTVFGYWNGLLNDWRNPSAIRMDANKVVTATFYPKDVPNR